MANLFKVGETVQLKSGGPVMTVSAVVTVKEAASTDGDVECAFFNAAQLVRVWLPSEALRTAHGPAAP